MKRFLIGVLIVTIFLTGCSDSVKIEEPDHAPEVTGTEQTEDAEDTVSVEEAGRTGDYADEFSVYNNPIDEYFLPRIYSWDKSQAEIRGFQDAYKKVWKAEFKSVTKWLRKKCIYETDKKNIELMEKSVSDYIERSKEVVLTELLDAYKVNPDAGKEKDAVSRMSSWGNGTRSRLNQIEGEIYRDASMRIINLYGGETGYEFRKIDYSEVKE